MAAGQQPTLAGLNGSLTSAAVRMRDLMQEVRDLNLQVGKLGLAGLETLGASPADAQDIIGKWAYINTPAALYYGAATQSPAFNFDDALAPCRAGL